ncbi:MAG: Crp/Fnr family transcriptional regulator [Rhodocyclaceae bacterium]|nr:Crp/Fnr family transcriptional regulator [Rhodocyclaceae bacterium]MBX3668678.1 Crp/Fnr family transcriptional regulator [Rhodocyclaceae bacterium]
MQNLDGEKVFAEWGAGRFKSGSTFGALSDGAIRFLCDHGRLVELQDGERLFQAGSPADSFFVVLEGELQCFREIAGQDVSINRVCFGQQIGYASMVGLFPRLGYGRACGRTLLIEITADLFYELHKEHAFDFGILMLNLSREMARRIRFLVDQRCEESTDQPV